MNNKPKASPLWSTSDMEHTSTLIAHISTHTQENTQTRAKTKSFNLQLLRTSRKLA